MDGEINFMISIYNSFLFWLEKLIDIENIYEVLY